MCSPDVAITHEIASTTGAASATCESAPKWDPVAELSKWGKSPGTQVQHTLAIRTKGTEFRHFLTSDRGTVWRITKSARTFAPLAPNAELPQRTDIAARISFAPGSRLGADSQPFWPIAASAIRSCSRFSVQSGSDT